MKKSIKIGNAGGYWGDDLNALNMQLTGGELDYITSDFLAEITMSILRKQQIKNPDLGYVTDFVDQIIDNIDLIIDKKVKIISNAGGINPIGCARKILEQVNDKNKKIKIAVVLGDNIVDNIDDFYPEKTAFTNMETDENFEAFRDKIQSANVYLGVKPVVKALETGADIVIAGRVTDTSITMAPMIYEFGWEMNDWQKLASGLVAGHIIECGAQSSGGNFTDWHLIKNWENFGYPIVEMFPNGEFIVTKHENTGGIVSVNSIKEQLLYEMGNPKEYISPDVVADFSTIQLKQVEDDKVKVSNVSGRPSTKFYKVSMAYKDGFRATGSIVLSAPKAMEKAKIFTDFFWKRLGVDFTKKNAEFIGYNACHQDLAKKIEPNEILLRFNVFDYDKSKLEIFSKMLSTIILSGPQGAAVTGGRPAIRSVMSYYPALLPKHFIEPKTVLLDFDGAIFETHTINSCTGFETDTVDINTEKQISDDENDKLPEIKNPVKVQLIKLCLARSGDKGDMANIGLIARNEKIYKYIKKHLTANKIKQMFKSIALGEVIRYEMDNLMALNFLLEKSLDGGGTKSLMIDAQGKTFASALLNQYFMVPEDILIQ